ncbi:MAG: 4Fe-4S dicluster domain-containing protein [Labilithrix sp.]|nr:4Fe-4S dicluster domain-containing protein [Labilithrix sp.]
MDRGSGVHAAFRRSPAHRLHDLPPLRPTVSDPRSIAESGLMPRRSFLAAIGAAGVAACTRAPREEIVPYVVQPPEVTPGRPRYYATAFALDGYATGLLVESHEGRPTKIEGNPRHPASLGATGAIDQALVRGLYDPGRLRGVLERGDVPTSWSSVEQSLRSGAWARARGRGLHVLCEPTSSRTLIATLDALRERFPETSVHFHAPATPHAVWEGARLALGEPLEPRFDLSAADVIVSLDADLLARGRAGVSLARAFADGRRLRAPGDPMNRLYAFEAIYTETGAAADHRIRVRPRAIAAIAAALLAAIGAPIDLPASFADPAAIAPHRRVVDAVARDLVAHRGRSLVVAGDDQPAIVHAMAWAMNAALENLGRTVAAAPSPIFAAGGPEHGLSRLADALAAGEVDTLVILDTDAAYTAPADVPLRDLLSKARQSAYLGLHLDETASACTFAIGGAHPLESWGDARAFDGTASIVQPLIAPLFGGRSAIAIVASLADLPPETDHARVRRTFALDAPLGDLEPRWRRALMRGVIEGTTTPSARARVRWGALGDAFAATPLPPAGGAVEGNRELDLALRLDPRVYDGRFASADWLLELPEPITKLTWTNAATLGPATARALTIRSGDVVAIASSGRAIEAPALVVPGQAEGTIGLALGWGRQGERRLGANAYRLRAARSHEARATVTKTGARVDLPITQSTHDLHGREAQIFHEATLEELRRGAPARREKRLSLFTGARPSAPKQWAMAIDLTSCTACGACVVACQAENNVATVGPIGVSKGRAMHWLRIDTYHRGDPDDPRVVAQPMLCQHCEKAPCEYVCPVNATVHSDDGLNQMVYNRCVGTRFCSNNCPYKVRRFNWFDYHEGEDAVATLVHNPDVTVRARGVMEKCTFCVQRIREHAIRTEVGRGPAPPPLATACEQVCPTKAIVFGDLAEQGSEVARLHRLPRAFDVLGELGTLPRVRYLARIRNPNPELS